MAEDWLDDVRKYVSNADEAVVAAIVRYCGIALQSRDSSLVSFSDAKETDRVRENYLKKKLGLTEPDSALDSAISAVGEIMKGDRTKNRVTVYYLLADRFGKLGLFGGAAPVAAVDAPSAAPVAAAGLAGTAAAAAASPGTSTAASADGGSSVAGLMGSGNGDTGSAGGGGDVGSVDGGGFGRWLPWLLLALAAIALFLLLKSCKTDEAPVAPQAADTSATAPMATENANTSATAPDAVAQAVPEGAGVIAAMEGARPKLTVYFDTGKSEVSNDLATAATGVKDYLAKNPQAKLAVSGYNDPTGNAAANAELSKNRAKGVAAALEKAGIPAASIALEKPADTTDASADKSQARRVEVTIKE